MSPVGTGMYSTANTGLCPLVGTGICTTGYHYGIWGRGGGIYQHTRLADVVDVGQYVSETCRVTTTEKKTNKHSKGARGGL
jgi:hypothetical protein